MAGQLSHYAVSINAYWQVNSVSWNTVDNKVWYPDFCKKREWVFKV